MVHLWFTVSFHYLFLIWILLCRLVLYSYSVSTPNYTKVQNLAERELKINGTGDSAFRHSTKCFRVNMTSLSQLFISFSSVCKHTETHKHNTPSLTHIPLHTVSHIYTPKIFFKFCRINTVFTCKMVNFIIFFFSLVLVSWWNYQQVRTVF